MTRRSSIERLARGCARRPWVTVAVWAAVVVACGGLFVAFGDNLQAADDFLSRPESKQAEELLAERLPGSTNDVEAVVVRSPELTIDDAAFRRRVQDLAGEIRGIGAEDVRQVTTWYDATAAIEAARQSAAAVSQDGETSLTDQATVAVARAAADQAAAQAAALVSKDRHTTIIPVTMAVASGTVDEHMADLTRVVRGADGKDGFEVVLTGSGSWEAEAVELSDTDLRRGEIIGVPIAMVILIVVFGSLIAALVPLVLAVVAIVVGAALTALLGEGFMMSVFAINVVTMMGLAVGIDYSLFIVSRFREERARGRAVPDAVGRSAATASRAVLFSGMTVVLALCGMLVVPFSIFISLGAGAIVVVLAAVAAALTLLPAALALIGDRVNLLRLPLGRSARRRSAPTEPTGASESAAAPEPVGATEPAGAAPSAGTSFWTRAAGAIMRRPLIGLLAGAGALVLLAAPGLTMQRGESGVSGLPEDLGTRRGYEMLKADFSAGLTSPILVVIDGDLSDPAVASAVQRLRASIEGDGRFDVSGFERSDDGKLGLLSLAVNSDATGNEALKAVRALREDIIPPTTSTAPARVLVGGSPAEFADMIDIVDRFTPIVIAAVLVLSCVLILAAFRSLVIAIQAVAMNLLSVGASYGLLTLVFQKGVGTAALGFSRVDVIEAWVPLLLFCVLFGLSMDYQVFLLSRIRERYDECGDTREAVAFGIQSTAGIITGAALIMVAVFAGMASGDLVMFQEIGFGLAIAVALDATLVRIVVVPSAMALLGRANWYLPKWLEWLPHVTVDEGPEATGAVVEGGPQGHAPTAPVASRPALVAGRPAGTPQTETSAEQ